MSKNYKVNANSSLLEFKRKHNLFVENGITEKVNEDIEKGKIDISEKVISKIELVLHEGDYTDIIFPKGIGLLSITINTHTLYLYNGALVNQNGQEVEGYTYDDYYVENGHIILSILGDHTDEVINSITYYKFESNVSNIILLSDTYHLYHPITREGTKLYKHDFSFSFGEGTTLHFSLISTQATKFSSLRALIGNLSLSYNISAYTESGGRGGKIMDIVYNNATGNIYKGNTLVIQAIIGPGIFNLFYYENPSALSISNDTIVINNGTPETYSITDNILTSDSYTVTPL